MASMKFDLPLLDYKTRFALWQVKMRAILAQSSDLDEALDDFGGKGQKSWTAEEKRKDHKALSLIQLHLHIDILQEDLISKMHVKMKLFTHKLQEGGSVMNHLSIFKEIVTNLVSMEVKYDDEDLALLLLCSLLTSFANFRDTILLSHDELTLAEVYKVLQMREKMKGMVRSDVSSSKGEVLQVRGRPEQKTYNNNNNRDKSKNGKCRSKSRGRDKFYRYCKKDTHVIEDCWKLQNKEKRNGMYKPKNKSDGDGKASVVSAVDNSDSGDVLVVFAGCVAGRDKWILDCACSFHICSNKDWFSSYESVQSGDVMRMGDNNPREIVGIGSVQIKMHDGMIRTLKDVRHIPGMDRNLISLSTLDAEGIQTLRFRWSDMNSAKLYVLRGSTLHGFVTAAAVSNDEPSKTNLWHMHLGHMSELGMAELINRDLLDGCTMGKMKFYEHCVFGKHKRIKFNASVHTTKDRRTKRSCGPCPRLIEECDIVHYAFSCAEHVENIHEPTIYTEAVVSGDREKWISAMQEEMQSLEKNGIWDVVRLPKHKKALEGNTAAVVALSTTKAEYMAIAEACKESV
ncbi:unnamed protein product [Miscanthus lutarioriparius]|uniref:GAG-pre-integrase domain-containing protein n=1 Tax=Miscanthus lutarioriparius TaxID=422564 RepID=A0A811PUY6_9POAL|nr:unnamed protein product [Miscanthus lutarioriparius]